MLVLAIFMPVNVARKKALTNAKISKDSKTGENGENGKNSKKEDKDKDSGTNFAQVPYIQYLITFRKQSVSAPLHLESEVNAIQTIFAAFSLDQQTLKLKKLMILYWRFIK